jgi:hypothetical protein
MIGAVSCHAELQRLKQGPAENEEFHGIGIGQFIVKCNGNADDVLETAMAVMKVVCLQCVEGWPTTTDWRAILPSRFVDRCAEEMTREQAEQLLERINALNEQERKLDAKNRPWTLDNWLHWMQPSERLWQWWDAKVEDSNRIRVWFILDSWPFGWGAVTWLFRGSGAVEVMPLEQAVD